MARAVIFSDIHANVVALDAVLGQIDRLEPDVVVCLGDVAATGPAPAQVIARLQERNWPVVRGNCDDALLRAAAGAAEAPKDEHDAIDQWCATQVGAEALAFVATFQPYVVVELGEITICCSHGSPRSNLDEVLPGTDERQLAHWFHGVPADLYAGGHTHIQMLRTYLSGYVINPGSVGLPFITMADGKDVNPLWAEYAVLDAVGAELTVSLKRIPLDGDAVLRSAAESDMPHRDWWTQDWRPFWRPS